MSNSPRRLLRIAAASPGFLEAFLQPRQSLSRSGLHHLHSSRRPSLLRHPRELSENGPRDRRQPADRTHPRPHLHRQVPQRRQRLHHRHQRRHSDSLARLLALRALQPHFHHVEVRAARKRAPPLESVELRHLRHALSRAGNRRQPQHPVGQLFVADDRHLVPGFGHRLARSPLPHHRRLRPVVLRLCLSAQLDHRQPVAVGNRPDHRADVSALHLLHGHRSEDDRPYQARPVPRRVLGRGRRDDPAAQPGRLRARSTRCSWSARQHCSSRCGWIPVGPSPCRSHA